MTNIEAWIIKGILRTLGVRKFLDAVAASQTESAFKGVVNKYRLQDLKTPPASWFPLHQLEIKEIAGRSLTIFRFKQKTAAHTLLYFPGGAYVTGPTSLQWRALKFLADNRAINICMWDYPKAPEHTVTDCMAASLAAYEYLIGALPTSQLTCMGDSAGASIAFSLCSELIEQGKTLPTQLLLLSPVLDASLSNPSIPEIEPRDVVLNQAGLKKCMQYFADGLAPDHPWLSPMNGKFEGMPKTIILAGSEEILYPDIQQLATKSGVQHWELYLRLGDQMPHVFPLFLQMPSAKKVLEDLIADCFS